MKYQDKNAETIDRWVENGWIWGKPISHEQFEKAKKGDYQLFLSPTKEMPRNWIGDVRDQKVLGLACGGAQQMPVLTALGAKCTVLDYSKRQLESEKEFAEKEGYDIRIVRFDMSEPLPFDDEEFDIIINPVSICYIEDVKPLFRECARILKPGGIFCCGFDNGINYLANDEKTIVNRMPFNPLKNPDQFDELAKEDDGVQFSHTFEEQIGGQLEAGFILTDLYEDVNSDGRLSDLNIFTYMVTRCLKK